MDTPNLIACGVALGALFATLWLAERMHDVPRRVLLVVVGLGLGLCTFELARFDQGLGKALAWVAMVAAPLFVIFGASAAAVKRFWGWPDLGDGPPRSAFLSLFVVVGMVLGSRQHARDIVASEHIGNAIVAGKITQDMPKTRMGWWDPPRLRRGAGEGGRELVYFPLGGKDSVFDPDSRWRFRWADNPAWVTPSALPLKRQGAKSK